MHSIIGDGANELLDTLGLTDKTVRHIIWGIGDILSSSENPYNQTVTEPY